LAVLVAADGEAGNDQMDAGHIQIDNNDAARASSYGPRGPGHQNHPQREGRILAVLATAVLEPQMD